MEVIGSVDELIYRHGDWDKGLIPFLFLLFFFFRIKTDNNINLYFINIIIYIFLIKFLIFN